MATGFSLSCFDEVKQLIKYAQAEFELRENPNDANVLKKAAVLNAELKREYRALQLTNMMRKLQGKPEYKKLCEFVKPKKYSVWKRMWWCMQRFYCQINSLFDKYDFDADSIKTIYLIDKEIAVLKEKLSAEYDVEFEEFQSKFSNNDYMGECNLRGLAIFCAKQKRFAHAVKFMASSLEKRGVCTNIKLVDSEYEENEREFFEELADIILEPKGLIYYSFVEPYEIIEKDFNLLKHWLKKMKLTTLAKGAGDKCFCRDYRYKDEEDDDIT
jgi:hypothetical protein